MRTKATPFLLILALIAMFSVVFGLIYGSVDISWQNFLSLITGHASDLTKTIVLHLRLPETSAAFIVGGLLALAGTFMQILLYNPLADPYVLGISGGAAIASLLGITFGLSLPYIQASSWIGSLVTMLVIFMLTSGKGRWSSYTVLLTGVVLAAGWSALISFILILSPNQTLRTMLFWLLGDINETSFSWLALILLIAATLYGLVRAKALNLLARDPIQAQTLGVNTRTLQYELFFISAILTATAVSLAGCIGFIGLIVPHLLRLMRKSSNHLVIIPGTILLGGSLLSIADTFSRSLFAPLQLPVGIFTALLGVPFFLFLMRRLNQRDSS